MTAATPIPEPSDVRERIAAGLERGFAAHGFAGRSVNELRDWSGVSLRTLYKYFPSRESMVVGALEYRDRSYTHWLAGGPGDGVGHVLHPLFRLRDWMDQVANIGCLYMNALSEYPDSTAVAAVVSAHKDRMAGEFLRRLDRVAPGRDNRRLADTLFLLHEGMSQAARHQGVATATDAAIHAARAALAGEGLVADDTGNVDRVGRKDGAHQ